MSPTLVSPAIELAAGIVVGLLAGLLGVGGGIITVPMLVELYAWQGIDKAVILPLAIGTSQASMIPAGIAAALTHARAGAIDENDLRRWAIGALCGAFAGLLVTRIASARFLTTSFATVAGMLAVYLWLNRTAPATSSAPGPIGSHVPVAGFVGMLAAALGIGAGTIGVPVMSLLGLHLRRAIGLGAALNAVVALPAVAGYVWLGSSASGRPTQSIGYVDLSAAALIGLASLVVVPVGASLSRRAPLSLLRLCLAACLGVIAARMALQAAGGG